MSAQFNCQKTFLSGATTPGLSGPGSDGNKVVLHIPQSSSITGTSPSDCLVSYPVHSLGSLTPLQRCSRCIIQPQATGHKHFVLGNTVMIYEYIVEFFQKEKNIYHLPNIFNIGRIWCKVRLVGWLVVFYGILNPCRLFNVKTYSYEWMYIYIYN